METEVSNKEFALSNNAVQEINNHFKTICPIEDCFREILEALEDLLLVNDELNGNLNLSHIRGALWTYRMLLDACVKK